MARLNCRDVCWIQSIGSSLAAILAPTWYEHSCAENATNGYIEKGCGAPRPMMMYQVRSWDVENGDDNAQRSFRRAARSIYHFREGDR